MDDNVTTETEMFVFGNQRALPIGVLQDGLAELYAHDFSFKTFADAISNVFARLLTQMEIDIDEQMKQDCHYLNELRMFFKNIDQVKQGK